MAAQAQIPSEQKETREKTISHTSLQKTQNKEFLIINACYSVAKYYLCKQNNKRSLLGRKQRSQVVRSFLNRYQFSCISKGTSLFSIRYTLINILRCDLRHFMVRNDLSYRVICVTLHDEMMHVRMQYIVG